MKLNYFTSLLFLLFVTILSAQELEIDEGDDMYGMEEVEMGEYAISGNPQNFKIIDNTFFLKAVVGQMQYGDFWFDQNTKMQRFLLPDSLKNIYPKAVLGDTILFAAYTPNLGEELWKYSKKDRDYSLINDINPGKNSSYIRNCVTFKGKAYFQCTTKEHGAELWVSDGTAEGIELVADAFKYDKIDIKGMLVYNDHIYYWSHKHLFVTNGEVGNVTEITLPETAYFSFTTLVPTEKYVAITISGFNGKRLYKYIPKKEQVLLVKDWPNVNSIINIWPEVLDDDLYFTVKDPETDERMLWTSDGTEKGTKQLFGKESVEMKRVNRLKPIGGKLFFTAFDDATGGNPWCFDPKTKSFNKIADIFKEPKSPYPHDFMEGNNGKIYFQSGFTNRILWVTDGTEAGTKIVKKAMKSGRSDFNNMEFFNGLLYFNSKVYSTSEIELWQTDGTTDGTYVAFDFK